MPAGALQVEPLASGGINLAKPNKQQELKQESVPPKVVTETPGESTSFGIMPGSKGLWLAIRVQSDGGTVVRDILTPKRFNMDFGETKHSAVARILGAFREFANERVS